MKLQFKKIKTRLTVFMFLLTMIPLTISVVVIYFQRVEAIKEAAFEKLTVIRDLKVNELKNWINEISNDLELFSKNEYIYEPLELLYKKEPIATEHIKSLATVRQNLTNITNIYDVYLELFITDSSGKVIVSTSVNSAEADKSRFSYFNEPMRTGKNYIQDIYYSKELKKNTMHFSTPILYKSETGADHIVGVLVASLDLEKRFHKLMLERSGMGKTGETLIVNRDGIALNELKWRDNAPLRLRIEAEPVKNALRRKTDIIEAKDYRGEPVLAAYTYIVETGWGFISKQDQREIYEQIDILLRNMVMIFIISMVAVYILSLILAQNFSMPIIEFTQVAQKIQTGDLTARSSIQRDDEYGLLGLTFNKMAEFMEKQIKIQEAIKNLNEIMVAEINLENFCTKITEKLVDVTHSDFGTFYFLGNGENKFEHIFSIGFDQSAMKALDNKIIQGAFSSACATNKITCINEISKDTIFTVNTIAGSAIPRSIVTIPIRVKEKVAGVISLGSLSDYSKESLHILEQNQFTLGTALSNILATEEALKLASELNAKNEELEGQAGELRATSMELQLQNRELADQRRQVEEASRLKSEFLSNMSHELRTPLNSIMALSSVLKMQTSSKLDNEETGYLEIIQRNGKNLLNLINDILDLSKIEAGHMEVTNTFFSLPALIENIMESIRPLAEEKGVGLTLEFSSHTRQIESDEKRVHQVIQNLVSNAVKFTEKGKVSIIVDSDDQKINVRVSDTGIGIAKKDLPYIFQEFKQVDGSTSRRYQGTGLGLAIARKAVTLLAGELTVDSEPGKGSTFTLTLPLTAWQVEAPEQKSLPANKNFNLQEKTVLVVDDEPDSLNMIADYLFKEGYNVITATSGRAALKLSQMHHPFAITLDLIMPEMDGWEVLQNLKKNPQTADIPVIMVSISEDKETAFALGATGYITKPVIKDDLITEINKVSENASVVMVVDDIEIERKNIIQMIEQEKMRAVSASNGKECLKILEKNLIPDVLVLDLLMPEMDGFEVLKTLRSDPRTISLPVIVVTAKDLTQNERRELNQHVASVLPKSHLTPQNLLEEIKKHLSAIKHTIPEMMSGTYNSNLQSKMTPGKDVVRADSKPALPMNAISRVLVIEDNESSAIQIKTILERENYLVDISSSGMDAIDFVKHTIPDGIILDLMMPGIDGFEVLDTIRSTKRTESIPVLILTAKDLTPDDFKKLKANHISQLVQKGDVEREGLLLKVNMMLREKPETRISNANDISSRDKSVTKQGGFSRLKNKTWFGTQPAILVIEDNSDNMVTIKAILKNRYTILEATNGEQGLLIASQELPDLILLDISLPGMDGFSVIKTIRESENISLIPVIALSAHAMKGDREKIIAAGCDDYISKPIDQSELLEKLKNLFES